MTVTTLPGTGTPISTDTLNATTGLNGGAPATSEQMQVTKVAFGSATFARYVDASNPFPVTFASLPTGANTIGAVAPLPNATVGPTAFTASDAVVAAPIGDGTLVTGASTAGSIVSLAIPSGFTAWTVLVKNWTNGTIYSEASFNSTNGTDGDWIDLKGRRTGTAPGVESVMYALVANGYYRGNGAGFTYYRLRFIGASTFPTVQITLTEAQGATFLNSGIPAGSSLLGKVGIDQTTPGTTNAVQFTNTTLAVTGTFFQGTQPVSFTWAGLTDTQLRASAVPVSLTSTTVTGSVAVTGPLTDTQLRAVAVPVSLTSTTITGTVAATQSGTWNIGSITTLPALATGANTIGAVTGPAAAALALDATLTGGTLKAIARTAAKGTAIAADLTSNPVDANTQALHVNLAGTNAVNATLSVETTKVIGTVNISAAQTVAAVTAITNALPAGANTIGAVNIAAAQTLATVTTVGTVSAVTSVASSTPATPTAFLLGSAAATNATSVKASAGNVYQITVTNIGAAVAFLKLYNLAVAPTVGTSVPALTLSVPANGVPLNVNFGELGLRLGTGIALATTNLIADADATAVVANQLKIALSYL